MFTPPDVAAVLRVYFAGPEQEEFIIVLLNTANAIIGLSQISLGGLASCIVETRQVFKAAIIAAHTHP